MATGLSSSAVGTIGGQVIMQGFTGYRIPLWLRRLVTMAPSFVVGALGIDATRALILSQVALSLVLPVPMIAAVIVLMLNLLLVLQIAGVPLPAFAACG